MTLEEFIAAWAEPLGGRPETELMNWVEIPGAGRINVIMPDDELRIVEAAQEFSAITGEPFNSVLVCYAEDEAAEEGLVAYSPAAGTLRYVPLGNGLDED